MNCNGYEYKTVAAPDGEVSLLLDGYASFGWYPDENRPAPGRGNVVTLYLKRDRRRANKVELTRLQRHFEACVGEVHRLQQAPRRTATGRALAVGLAGTAFLAGAVFAVCFLSLDDSTGMRLAAGGLAILAVLYVLAGLNFLKKHRQRRADALQRRRRHRKRPRR